MFDGDESTFNLGACGEANSVVEAVVRCSRYSFPEVLGGIACITEDIAALGSRSPESMVIAAPFSKLICKD
jgi:hypothetical protein